MQKAESTKQNNDDVRSSINLVTLCAISQVQWAYPPSIVNCTTLDLSGEIPDDLLDCRNLVVLSLAKNNLSGVLKPGIGKLPYLRTIPPELSKVSSLQCLFLHNNQHVGPIPEELFQLKQLTHFELNNNRLTGPIPVDLSKLELLLLSHLNLKGPVFAILLVVCGREKKEKADEVESFGPIYSPTVALKRFDQKELEIATGFFSQDNILGSSSLSMSDKCFIKEIKTLSQLKPRNLVKVLGYAWENGKFKALVQEFVENGNLDKVIHDPAVDQSRWTLQVRVNLCASIENGLVYLHSYFDSSVIHCDLKPSNILLDGDWDAHVSDFGTAFRTIGYLAPAILLFIVCIHEESYNQSRCVQLWSNTDGVQRRPTGVVEENGLPITLCELVEIALDNGKEELLQILYPSLASCLTKKPEETIEKLLKLALIFICPTPEGRRDMKEVSASLMKLKPGNTSRSQRRCDDAI
ncbi:Protein kinase domain [Dillenia turbinata]|uniref:Protein kinase domain n=1 Tax=Dillenia turbinata TaxID=194707 RepID=A0AAN8VDU6_9MAGN